jgi:hypothetical protein
MSDPRTYCVDLSPETADWLEATAEACNVDPEGVVRLLVIATMFGDDDAMDPEALAAGDLGTEEGGDEDESGITRADTTRALLREALAAIHATRPTPNSGPATIVREDLRSMFEMMKKAQE